MTLDHFDRSLNWSKEFDHNGLRSKEQDQVSEMPAKRVKIEHWEVQMADSIEMSQQTIKRESDGQTDDDVNIMRVEEAASKLHPDDQPPFGRWRTASGVKHREWRRLEAGLRRGVSGARVSRNEAILVSRNREKRRNFTEFHWIPFYLIQNRFWIRLPKLCQSLCY